MFSAILKGKIFCVFLFATKDNAAFSKWGLFLKDPTEQRGRETAFCDFCFLHGTSFSF